MHKLVRPFVFLSIFVTALLLTLALQAPAAQASTPARGVQATQPAQVLSTDMVTGMIPISGTSFGPLFSLGTSIFTKTADAVYGHSFPTFIICNGPVDVDFPSLPKLVANGCGPAVGNGFRGTIVADERVVRRPKDAPPTFVFEAEQAFSGFIVLNGQTYFGTVIQRMDLTGELNTPPAGVNCYDTPESPACGAKNYSGTWEIIGGQTAGQMLRLLGGGTTAWTGLGSLPGYQGDVQFANTSYLPIVSKE